jgi:hypothetical protein
MTQNETEILLKLKELKKQGKQIYLQLWPGSGHSTIDVKGDTNRLFINEGRDGTWEDISEYTYDQLVIDWDSRTF